jgi:hypothetical protein
MNSKISDELGGFKIEDKPWNGKIGKFTNSVHWLPN